MHVSVNFLICDNCKIIEDCDYTEKVYDVPSKKIYPKIKNDLGMAYHTPCGPLKKAKKQVTMPLLSLSSQHHPFLGS